MRSRCLAACSVGALALASAPTSFAQGSPDVERADQLFREAKSLTDRGTYDGVCPKLEESQRLDPALGTQFNLADCYEHTSRTVEAYDLFGVVAAAAHAAGKDQRERESRARMHALESKVSRLRIAGPADGMQLRVDGHELPRAGPAITLLPGSHAVDASADGRLPWHVDVTLQPGQTLDLGVPELPRLPELPALVAPTVWPPVTPPSPLPRPVAPLPPPPERGTSHLGPARTVALAGGALGVVGLGVGAAAGIVSISAHDSASNQCPTPSSCSNAGGASEWTTATRWGTVSTVGFAAGGAILAGAVVIWLVAPRARTARATAMCTAEYCGVGGLF